jgi:iron complex transport system ATP-binding protein
MTTLAAQNLGCRYGTREVIRALSLSIHPGEVVAILGANGAGKTTLLHSLARIRRPAQGTVTIDSQEIWKLNPGEVARHLALMPQSERRDSPLSVEEAVRLGRAPHRGWFLPLTSSDEAILEEALEATSLVQLRNRPITELSGGEWRRVVLARALAQQADLLILDEPVSGMDLRFQIEVLQLIRRLASRNRLGAVLTLHDLNLAAIYADRIALLAQGRLAAIGAPADILTQENIKAVFGVSVLVIQHPIHKSPLIIP